MSFDNQNKQNKSKLNIVFFYEIQYECVANNFLMTYRNFKSMYCSKLCICVFFIQEKTKHLKSYCHKVTVHKKLCLYFDVRNLSPKFMTPFSINPA